MPKTTTKKESFNDFRDFYKFYKVDIANRKITSKNLETDCPICNTEDKFHFNIENGLFSCKAGSCKVEGNPAQFITEYYNACLAYTNDEDFNMIQENRGLPVSTLKKMGLAFNADHNQWLVPFHRPGNETLAGLGIFYPLASDPKMRFRVLKINMGSSGKGLYRPFHPKTPFPKGSTIWITEGEWDVGAIQAACNAAKAKLPYLAGMPGSSWKEDWNSEVAGCHVIFFIDRDDNYDAAVKNIQKHAQGFSYAFADWNLESLKPILEAYPSVKDPRDVYQVVSKKAEVHAIFLDMAASAITPDTLGELDDDYDDTEGAEVRKEFSYMFDTIDEYDNYDKLHATVSENLYSNDSMHQCFDIMMASSVSVNIPKVEPINMFLVGAPSSGKTTALNAFGGKNELFDYLSKVTATSLISGGGGAKDFSNLPKFNGKTVIIKDLTTILGMPESVQGPMWDILREAFDGHVKVTFGNGRNREYSGIKFNIIAGITYVVYEQDDADKGERFLKMDYLGTDYDENLLLDAALDGYGNRAEKEKNIRDAVMGYYKHLHNNFPEDPIEIERTLPALHRDSPYYEMVKALAILVERTRTKVKKDRTEGIIFRPRSGIGSRVALQFKTIIRNLAYIRGDSEINEYDMDCIKKIAFDTVYGFRLEAIKFIHKNGEACRKQLKDFMNVSDARIHRVMEELEAIKLVNIREIRSKNGAGRNTFCYRLAPILDQCMGSVHDHSIMPASFEQTARPDEFTLADKPVTEKRKLRLVRAPKIRVTEYDDRYE